MTQALNLTGNTLDSNVMVLAPDSCIVAWIMQSQSVGAFKTSINALTLLLVVITTWSIGRNESAVFCNLQSTLYVFSHMIVEQMVDVSVNRLKVSKFLVFIERG